MLNFGTFDLNLLRVLDALLREGTTVGAGERLGMSQPAVSNALSRLRYAMGDPLFVRHRHGLTPTDYTRGLAVPLRQELDRLEQLLSGPDSFDPKYAEMTFRIAGSDFFAELLMPPLADALSRHAPGIRVQLVDLVPRSYISSLEEYEADLALIPEERFPEWVDSKFLFQSSFATIARRGNPAIAALKIKPGEAIPLDLFCSLGHVLFSPEGNLQAMGDAALARLGRTRRVVVTLPVFSGVCRAVSESDLIALVPRQLAARLASELKLNLYLPPMPIAPGRLVGAWHRRATTNPAQHWVRELVASILEPLNVGEDI